MSTQEVLERASAALTDLAFALIPEEKRAEKAEQQVKELTNEIKRMKESEGTEIERLKDIIRGRRARVEELAEENRLLKRSADAAHYVGRELKKKILEKEKENEELRQKTSGRAWRYEEETEDEEWDEESLVRETYGRRTYNLGDTKLGPIYVQSEEEANEEHTTMNYF